jgi:hypothetical protein
VVGDGRGLETQQGGEFLPAVGMPGEQTDDLETVGICQRFEEGEQLLVQFSSGTTRQ